MNRVKILLLGEQNSGKTQSILYMINDQPIYKDNVLSLYHKCIKMGDKDVVLTVLDTKHNLTNKMTFISFEDIDKILIFTNLTMPYADQRVMKWINFCQKNLPSIPINIVGTVKKNNKIVTQNISDLENNIRNANIYTIDITQESEVYELYQALL